MKLIVVSRAAIKMKTSPSQSARPPTRERILDAAEGAFARRGYDAASLAAIAADVGIRTPSLYKHFESKRELYGAVLERLIAPHANALHEAMSRPAGADDASANLERIVALFLDHPNLARVVQHATLTVDEDTENTALEEIVRRWYRPLFTRALELTPSPKGVTSEALLVAFHSLLSGIVTLGPLHAALGLELDREALGPLLSRWNTLALARRWVILPS